ncbi:DUF3461 family protein [Psychromonas sp. MME2]|uniref:DUF3461 family protein n=1 Tax=unclassified Psychromonas TaxID=2614957 RepID=UPI00339CBD9B
MYQNLQSIGITNVDEIERYSIRQEGDNDILKIYFKKDKGAHQFFSRSVKFKFPRQHKKISADHGGRGFRNVYEINSSLRYITQELDTLTVQVKSEKELKQQILNDLKHLQAVVASKIAEIESKLDKL